MTATSSVDRNIPIPPRLNGGGYYKYPWESMEIGDSFLATVTLSTMSSVANRAAKRTGRKFSCRTTKDGIRVWRIA